MCQDARDCLTCAERTAPPLRGEYHCSTETTPELEQQDEQPNPAGFPVDVCVCVSVL